LLRHHLGAFEGGLNRTLSISYGHVGCLKARAFPPPV
jgi:hypothetical protein